LGEQVQRLLVLRKVTDLLIFLCHSRKVPENEWIHLAFTWQRTLGTVTIYFNGIIDVTKDDPLTSDSNKDLFLTNHPFYIIGRKYDEERTFNGWMRDLVVIFQVLSAEEIVLLKGNYEDRI
jgi:hypothetical protein